MDSRGLITRLLRRLLFAGVPSWARDAARGDLDEEYARVAARLGNRAANRWYVREALLLSARYLGERWRGAPARAALSPDRNPKMRLLVMFADLPRDLRHALRQVGARPLFWAGATLTLGVAVGFNASSIALVNAVLFKPVTHNRPERVVRLYARPNTGPASSAFSYLDWQTFENGTRTLAGVAAVHLAPLSMRIDRVDDQLLGKLASTGYFALLDVPMARGRSIAAVDAAAGADPVVLLSEHYWRRKLGADPSVIGRHVTINGRPFTIVGIVDRRFSGSFPIAPVDLWLPLESSLGLLGTGAATDGRQRPLAIRLFLCRY